MCIRDRTYTIVGQYTLYLAGSGAHEAAAGPGYKTYVVEHPLHPSAAVGIEHLSVLCHDHMRGLVAILPHVCLLYTSPRADIRKRKSRS